MLLSFEIQTKEPEELYDITEKVQNHIEKSGVRHGVCNVFTPHSTAAVVIMENADPALCEDFLGVMRELIPQHGYKHNKVGAPNAAAHIKSAMINPNITIVVDHGRAVLGQWQGIMFCEFDGPRTRAIHVQVVSE